MNNAYFNYKEIVALLTSGKAKDWSHQTINLFAALNTIVLPFYLKAGDTVWIENYTLKSSDILWVTSPAFHKWLETQVSFYTPTMLGGTDTYKMLNFEALTAYSAAALKVAETA